jgi:hypothetical protein
MQQEDGQPERTRARLSEWASQSDGGISLYPDLLTLLFNLE